MFAEDKPKPQSGIEVITKERRHMAASPHPNDGELRTKRGKNKSKDACNRRKTRRRKKSPTLITAKHGTFHAEFFFGI